MQIPIHKKTIFLLLVEEIHISKYFYNCTELDFFFIKYSLNF